MNILFFILTQYKVFFRENEWYNRCHEWLLIAGGRRLWELDLVWDKTIKMVLFILLIN